MALRWKIVFISLAMLGLVTVAYVSYTLPTITAVIEAHVQGTAVAATPQYCPAPFDTDYLSQLEKSDPGAFMFAGCGGQM